MNNTPESAGDFINVCTNSSGPILLSLSFKKKVKYFMKRVELLYQLNVC